MHQLPRDIVLAIHCFFPSPRLRELNKRLYGILKWLYVSRILRSTDVARLRKIRGYIRHINIQHGSHPDALKALFEDPPLMKHCIGMKPLMLHTLRVAFPAMAADHYDQLHKYIANHSHVRYLHLQGPFRLIDLPLATSGIQKLHLQCVGNILGVIGKCMPRNLRQLVIQTHSDTQVFSDCMFTFATAMPSSLRTLVLNMDVRCTSRVARMLTDAIGCLPTLSVLHLTLKRMDIMQALEASMGNGDGGRFCALGQLHINTRKFSSCARLAQQCMKLQIPCLSLVGTPVYCSFKRLKARSHRGEWTITPGPFRYDLSADKEPSRPYPTSMSMDVMREAQIEHLCHLLQQTTGLTFLEVAMHHPLDKIIPAKWVLVLGNVLTTTPCLETFTMRLTTSCMSVTCLHRLLQTLYTLPRLQNVYMDMTGYWSSEPLYRALLAIEQPIAPQWEKIDIALPVDSAYTAAYTIQIRRICGRLAKAVTMTSIL